MIATSANRVAEQTSEMVNEQIRRSTDMNIAYFAAHPGEIEQRLDELDQEWDIDRALGATASSLSILGLVMGILGRRRWLMLPVVVQGFFMQHAVQGWCPPLPALRRMGFRTQVEIEAERYALKALKGDFRDLEGDEDADAESRADKILDAIRGEHHGRGGSLRRVGDESNRRSMRGGNPGKSAGGSGQGKRKKSGKGKPGGADKKAEDQEHFGLDENDLPRSDVGPTS